MTQEIIQIGQAAGWVMARVRRDITEEVLLTRWMAVNCG
jgi:hypothetical protein